MTRIIAKVVAERPIPALAMMSEAKAAQVQNPIRNDRVEVLIRARTFAVKIPQAGKVTLAQLSGDTEFVHEARSIVQDERHVSHRGAAKDDVVNIVPIGPVHIDLEVPIFGGAKGNAGGDKLGETHGGVGGTARSIRIELGVTRIIHLGCGTIIEAQGPLRTRLPPQTGVKAEVPTVTLEPELVGGVVSGDPLFEGGLG